MIIIVIVTREAAVKSYCLHTSLTWLHQVVDLSSDIIRMYFATLNNLFLDLLGCCERVSEDQYAAWPHSTFVHKH